MLRKICGLFLIFTMMLGLNTSVFAASERIQENQKDVDKYVQEYKGVKYDIRMNSAPKGFLNSIDLKTDESVELNTNDEKDLINNNDVNMMRSGMLQAVENIRIDLHIGMILRIFIEQIAMAMS